MASIYDIDRALIECINEETGEITDITYSGSWDFGTDTVTADTTLYLKYDINSYNVI